jgi:DnaA family protein
MKGQQLPLSVLLPQAPTLDNFFAGPNADAVTAVRALARREAPSQVLVTGGPGSGKSHLLQGAAAAAGEGAHYASLRDADPRELLEVAWLALDDADDALSTDAGAIPLLRLIDARRAAGRPLLLAAQAPPTRLPTALADLRTRLSAMLVLALKPLRDADRRELLRAHARERGLTLPDEVANWLLGHFSRDAGTLLGVLEELDRAALSAQRRLTLPFAQTVLGPRVQPPLDLENGRTGPG